MPRALLISTFNCDTYAWNGVCYEFLSIIAEMEASPPVAPHAARGLGALLPRRAGAPAAMARDIVLGARLMWRGRLLQPMRVEEEHEVCLFMCQLLRDVRNVEQVKGWRERSRLAVAFILESWTSSLARFRAELKLLDRFDHVFVLNAAAIPEMQRYTTTPISFLPTGSDSLAACPLPRPPERVVDVLCIGRQLGPVHERMLEIARRRNLFYVFDIWSNMRARDWAQSRAANADMTKRSRYAIVWAPATVPSKGVEAGADDALSTRYFELAAGGAVMLGSRSRSREFGELFDWPDAVVEIAPDGSDLEARLDALDADPARRAAARRANVVNALRRHDWAYRWDRIIATLGLERSPGHAARLAALEEMARQAEAAPPQATLEGVTRCDMIEATDVYGKNR